MPPETPDSRIHFDDAIQPATSIGNGVYSLRQVRSTTGVGSISGPAQAKSRKQLEAEAESNNAEERDFKTKQVSYA